eukprot:7213654-Ditylum_brightwellii.AAC.1
MNRSRQVVNVLGTLESGISTPHPPGAARQRGGTVGKIAEDGTIYEDEAETELDGPVRASVDNNACAHTRLIPNTRLNKHPPSSSRPSLWNISLGLTSCACARRKTRAAAMTST